MGVTVGDVPAGLGEAGTELWNDVTAGRRLTAANKALLLNICRIADRLDELADELAGRDLVVVNHQGTETPNPLLTEHRMQLSTMSQLMQRMGIGELPKVSTKASVRDQMAEKRAERERKRAAGQ